MWALGHLLGFIEQCLLALSELWHTTVHSASWRASNKSAMLGGRSCAGRYRCRNGIVWRSEGARCWGAPRLPGKGRAACGFLAAGRGAVTSAVGLSDNREMRLSSSCDPVAGGWRLTGQSSSLPHDACILPAPLLGVCVEIVKALWLRGHGR